MDESIMVKHQVSPPPRGIFEFEDDGELVHYTAREMLEANSDDTALCLWLGRATVNESITIGGGAAPVVVIKRVA